MFTGDDLREARKKKGKTQEELAEEMNISLRQLSRFENNENLGRYVKFVGLLAQLDIIKII